MMTLSTIVLVIFKSLALWIWFIVVSGGVIGNALMASGVSRVVQEAPTQCIDEEFGM